MSDMKNPLTYKNLTLVSTQLSHKNINLSEIYKQLTIPAKIVQVFLNFGHSNENVFVEDSRYLKHIIINNPKYVGNTSNKVTFKKILLNNDLPVCTGYYISKGQLYRIAKGEDVLADISEVSFPVVAKKKVGSKGEGMVYLATVEDFNNFVNNIIDCRKYFGAVGKNYTKTQILSRYFFEEVFNGDKGYNEVRVHVAKQLYNWPFRSTVSHTAVSSEGERIDLSEVIQNDRGILFCIQKFSKSSEEDAEIKFGKNIALGNAYWSRSKMLRNLPKYKGFDQMLEACQAVLKATNLDIAGIDVVFTRSGQFAFLEANTSPAICSDTDTRTLQTYMDALPVIIINKLKHG